MSRRVPQGLQTVGRGVVEISLSVGIGEVHPCGKVLIHSRCVCADCVPVKYISEHSACAVQVLIGDEEVAVLTSGREGDVVLDTHTELVVGLPRTFLEVVGVLKLDNLTGLVHKGRAYVNDRSVKLGSVLLVLTLDVVAEAELILCSRTESGLVLGIVGSFVEGGGQGVGNPRTALLSSSCRNIYNTVGGR
ncbi:unknown [Alistipes sp. CAG:831]|nr:unknown [Alistipes sp. CAG:831]